MPKKAEKTTKTDGKQKISSDIVDLNLTISLIILNNNGV